MIKNRSGVMQEKPDYYYRQSAVLPFRREGDDLQILMVTSRKKKRWILPKGIIEPHLSPADSAVKEALEEGGIIGLVDSTPIGQYCYKKWGGSCQVEVFVLEVTEVLEHWEEEFRDREWMGLAEAMERIKEEDLKKIFSQLPTFLKRPL
jgi:8-oxo-dGTP pyrophosphatase MutT (NUDIX family)